jgi:hypothetical protein
MEQLPWLVKLPANSSTSLAEYYIDIGPLFEHVVAVHATGWRISASVMPPELKILFDSDIGNRKTGLYSEGVLSGTSTPVGVINNGLLITPNTTLLYDSQEYQVPRLLCGRGTESLRRLRVTVSNFAGGPANFDGTLYIEVMVTVDTGAHRYQLPEQYSDTQKAVMNYYITEGRKPRQY